jgi:peptidoglycan/LPS O-acetylase OafA/YrhL
MTIPRTLGVAFLDRENNLDIIRLVAAIIVLISHCYPLTGNSFEPFVVYLWQYDTGGGLAVSTFFFISGLLITKSAEQRNWAFFAKARFLRLAPALAALAVMQYLVLGPIFTTLNHADYLRAGFGHLATASVFNVHMSLPGVFQDLPSRAVNGSLWTIPVEASFYVISALMVAFGALSKRTALPLAIILLVIHVWLSATGYNWGNQGPPVMLNISAYNFTKLLTFYLVGAAAWYHREQITLDPMIGVFILILMYLCHSGIAKPIAYFLCLPYLVLFFGFYRHVPLKFYDKIGDLSYGTYLYAFPVQQAFVALSDNSLTPLKLALLSIPVTLIFALGSWRVIEKPCLSLKTRYNHSKPVLS